MHSLFISLIVFPKYRQVFYFADYMNIFYDLYGELDIHCLNFVFKISLYIYLVKKLIVTYSLHNLYQFYYSATMMKHIQFHMRIILSYASTNHLKEIYKILNKGVIKTTILLMIDNYDTFNIF